MAERTLDIQGGDTAATLARQSATSSVQPPQTADQFNNALIQLLQRHQQLGTKRFQEQGIAGQEEQAKRVFSTPSNLIGAAPGIQAGARNAAVSAVSPTIQQAQNASQTFGEQIRSFGDAIQSTRSLMQDYQNQQLRLQDQMRENINFALKLGGSAGLEALLKSNPEAFKIAGFDTKTIEGLIPALKAQEQASSQPEQTASMREYEFAKANGFTGTFDQWVRREDPNAPAGGGLTPGQAASSIQKYGSRFVTFGNDETVYDAQMGDFIDLPTYQERTGQTVGLPSGQTNFSAVKNIKDGESTGSQPSSVQEYEYAKSQGYQGSYEQWLRSKANFDDNPPGDTGRKSVITGVSYESRLSEIVGEIYKGRFGKFGARERAIQSLQQEFPGVDVASAIYARVPDGYETNIKTGDEESDDAVVPG